MAEDRRVVAVWRSLWGPYSETFVRDHVRSLQRWTPVTMGLYRLPGALDVQVDVAPFPRSPLGRRCAGLSRRTGHRFGYDRVVRRHRPRLVHAHFGTGAVEALPLARRHGLPLVVTFHGHDLSVALAEDVRGTYRRRLAAVLDEAALLLPVSGFLAGRLLELGAPADKVVVHHLGIPVHERLADPAAPREGLLFVGRLIAQKGVRDLLAAYAGLPPQVRARTPVRIVGDGPELADLQRRAAAIGDGDIRFLGVLPPSQVRDLLASAAVLVAPSTRVPGGGAEGFGLALLEASLAGVPVVSYDYAGVPEAVLHGRTGLLAPVGDVAALGAAVSSLLADPALAQRLGREGQLRVVRDFDLAARTVRLEQLYDDVTAGVRPAARSGGAGA